MRLDQATLRSIDKAGTPAPWCIRDAMGDHGVERVIVSDAKTTRPDHVVASTGVFPDTSAPPDARLIAAARNSLPLLLDVVEAARAFRGQMVELDAALDALDDLEPLDE